MSTPPKKPSVGTALFALGAAFGTAALQSDLKVLRELGYATLFLLFLRFVGVMVTSATMVALFTPTRDNATWKVFRKFQPVDLRVQLVRGCLMLGTTLGVFLSTLFLSVVQLSVVSVATWPLFALLLAPRYGETVRKRGFVVASTVVSFCGVVLLVLAAGVDDAGRFLMGSLILCGGSLCTAASFHENVRSQKNKENKHLVMFFQALPGSIAMSTLFVPLLVTGEVEVTSGMFALEHVPWLILVVVLGYLPQLFYFLAAKAPVTQNTPIASLQVPFGGLLDWWRDATVPSPLGFAGIAVMMTATILAWPAIFAREDRKPPEAGTK